MKLVFAAILLLSVCAFAGVTEFGVHGGLMVPTGDFADVYKLSPMIGGNLLAHMTSYAIEASASYIFLSPEDVLGTDYSANMFAILGGVRSYSGTLFLGGGLALHIISWDSGTADDSNSEFGAYGNVGTILPMGGNDIELSAKLHWIDFDDVVLTLTAGINF